MKLNTFDNAGFARGAPRLKEAMWLLISGVLVASWLPGSGWRKWLLHLFGAHIGLGVVIKPGLKVKFPWKLTIGDHCWIGEDAWIDNLAEVRLGAHVCVSQGVYLCTGSHDWAKDGFDLVTRPIRIGDHAWVGAFSRVAPGTVIEEGAVLGLGAVAKQTLTGWSIYAGNPAVKVKTRPRELSGSARSCLFFRGKSLQ